MHFHLEICCFDLPSAIIAQRAGAHSVELCADPANGGTTPSLGLIRAARKELEIALYPIIRARGGDFLYSDEEFEIMLADIVHCKKAGCDGIVTGLLLSDGKVDKARCKKIIQMAYPMGATFHRAFDWTANPFEALEDIIELGFERVLSSGQQPIAIEGISLLADLVKQADQKISIMPGSGVRSSNIIEIAKNTGAWEFHSSARTQRKTNMEFSNAMMREDQSVVLPSQLEVEAMLDQLKKYFHK